MNSELLGEINLRMRAGAALPVRKGQMAALKGQGRPQIGPFAKVAGGTGGQGHLHPNFPLPILRPIQQSFTGHLARGFRADQPYDDPVTHTSGRTATSSHRVQPSWTPVPAMKHYSGIDYEHFLDDIRDMYPFSVEEAVLVELVANALDAKTSLIDIRYDPAENIFHLIDNGHGMDPKGFEMYHNFSTSFKRKGQGIGFAGLGAKLALRISERIVTETRSKKFWGASEWKFERRKKTAHPVWFDLQERTLPHEGTRVTIYLKQKSSLLASGAELTRIMLTHYLPLLVAKEFYQSVRIYRPITVLLNGELLRAPELKSEKEKQFLLRRGRSRKPYALARFELHGAPLPDSMQGIAISTFGKIIRRDWLKQHVKEFERITGIIEVPELVECLTTSKSDFRKEGTAGAKYYRFSKAAQQEFRRWLEEINLLDPTQGSPDRDTQRLQRVVNHIVAGMPDLQQFFGFRQEREVLVHSAQGNGQGDAEDASSAGELSAHDSSAESRNEAETEHTKERGGITLEDGTELPAERRVRMTKFGPAIRHVHASERADISWMEGETVLINTAHPTYHKAEEKKILEYHNLFAVALAMLREVPSAQEKLALLEQFMSQWGRV
ncbi:MAG TPA: ATP-binding protein [Bacteroidota bacterium]|nr:ATP-binding protein [Bacteroidota bacterium]